MVPRLETERLILQPLALGDAEQTQPLFAQWEVVKFLNNKVPWPFPEDGVLAYYRDVALPAMGRGEEYHWTIRPKERPTQIVGAISLSPLADVHRGFWLGTAWQGKGWMTEAAVAVTDFWFETLGFAVLRTAKAMENVGSRRISEKLGMRVVEIKESHYVSGTHATEVWEITVDEWRRCVRGRKGTPRADG